MLTLAYDLNHKVYTKLYTVDATLESIYCLFLLIHGTSTKMETETETQTDRAGRKPQRYRLAEMSQHCVVPSNEQRRLVKLSFTDRKSTRLNSSHL